MQVPEPGPGPPPPLRRPGAPTETGVGAAYGPAPPSPPPSAGGCPSRRANGLRGRTGATLRKPQPGGVWGHRAVQCGTTGLGGWVGGCGVVG